jgi:hypothetical protein
MSELQAFLDNWRDDDWNPRGGRSDTVEDHYNLVYVAYIEEVLSHE